jgi:hypothetical protein
MQSAFLARFHSGSSAESPTTQFSEALRPARPLARRLLLLLAVNEDCGSPDRFGHCLAEAQGQAQSPSSWMVGAVCATPDGSHIPVQIERGQQTGW